MNEPLQIENLEFKPRTDGPAGLGGWLILPILGLFLTVALIGFSAITQVFPVFFGSTWVSLTTPGGPGYHAMWRPYFLMTAFSHVVMLTAGITALVLIFKKSKRLPLLMIGFYLFSVFGTSVDYWAASSFLPEVSPVEAEKIMPEAIKDLGRSIFACLIWIPYFFTSKRVKNTFVH